MESKGLKFIDLHCHYDNLSAKEIKEQKKETQISVCAAVSFESIQILENLKKENIKGLYFAYGLYPDVLLTNSLEENLNFLININFKNADAIGEVGIDYKITKEKDKRKEQEVLFLKQLEIAEDLNMPIIIHTRYATKRMLELLKNTNHKKIILHWFSGTPEEIQTALDRGYYLTVRFGTPKINNCEKYLDQIFIETDFPIPFKGEKIKLADIEESYRVFCKENNIDLEVLKKKVQNNFFKLFTNNNI